MSPGETVQMERHFMNKERKPKEASPVGSSTYGNNANDNTASNNKKSNADNPDLDTEHSNLTPEQLTFNDQGLIPCIVQDALTGDVLMMAWMNEESVRLTIKWKSTWFYSRSRKCLWRKGETSGNTQTVIDLRYDCDADCLLARVVPAGPACHTGETSCFYRAFDLGLS